MVSTAAVEWRELAAKNRGLAVAAAKRFLRPTGLSLDDLVSEADMGLVIAARAWRGMGSFSTYATTVMIRRLAKVVGREQSRPEVSETDVADGGAVLASLVVAECCDQPRPDVSGLLGVLSGSEAAAVAAWLSGDRPEDAVVSSGLMAIRSAVMRGVVAVPEVF